GLYQLHCFQPYRRNAADAARKGPHVRGIRGLGAHPAPGGRASREHPSLGGPGETWSVPPETRRSSRGCVLGRARRLWATGAPCVLPSDQADAPRRRATFRQTLLVTIELAEPVVRDAEVVRDLVQDDAADE